jgi:hypothetical protein
VEEPRDNRFTAEMPTRNRRGQNGGVADLVRDLDDGITFIESTVENVGAGFRLGKSAPSGSLAIGQFSSRYLVGTF